MQIRIGFLENKNCKNMIVYIYETTTDNVCILTKSCLFFILEKKLERYEFHDFIRNRRRKEQFVINKGIQPNNYKDSSNK